MPENNHEVIIDGYVYPDTVTITLANDDFVGSRDYVSKDLYESVSGANDYWQAENAKLRELARKLAWCAVVTDCGACDGACEDGDEWHAGHAICTAVAHMMHELEVKEVDE